MKRLVFPTVCFLLIAQFAWSQPAQSESTNSDGGPAFSFTESEHDFGDITQGETVEHVFSFSNSGSSPLIINNVLTTCGCTAPEWPKNPIAPGEEGEIKVRFNSSGKIGRQNKIITIQSNVDGGTTRLKIISMVLPKKEGETTSN